MNNSSINSFEYDRFCPICGENLVMTSEDVDDDLFRIECSNINCSFHTEWMRYKENVIENLDEELKFLYDNRDRLMCIFPNLNSSIRSLILSGVEKIIDRGNLDVMLNLVLNSGKHHEH